MKEEEKEGIFSVVTMWATVGCEDVQYHKVVNSVSLSIYRCRDIQNVVLM